MQLVQADARIDVLQSRNRELAAVAPTKVTPGMQAAIHSMTAGLGGALAGAMDAFVPEVPPEIPVGLIGAFMLGAGLWAKSPNTSAAVTAAGLALTDPVIFNGMRVAVRTAAQELGELFEEDAAAANGNPGTGARPKPL